jgi:hypothetical protein
MGYNMKTAQILTLLLALSGALNVALATGVTARHTGADPAQAILTAADTAGTVMAIFLTAGICLPLINIVHLNRHR